MEQSKWTSRALLSGRHCSGLLSWLLGYELLGRYGSDLWSGELRWQNGGSIRVSWQLDANTLVCCSGANLVPPSGMLSELSGLDRVVADAPTDEDLAILTDSLSFIQKLESRQRRDFPEWLPCSESAP